MFFENPIYVYYCKAVYVNGMERTALAFKILKNDGIITAEAEIACD